MSPILKIVLPSIKSLGLCVKEYITVIYNNCWNCSTDVVHLFPIWTKMGGSDGVFVPLELLEELGILIHNF